MKDSNGVIRILQSIAIDLAARQARGSDKAQTLLIGHILSARPTFQG